MKYTNIFQSNEYENAIAEGLHLPKLEGNKYGFSSFYFEAFFYLTKRFGMPAIFDEHKDAANWKFKVKEFKIWIRLASTDVNIMIFGDAKYKSYSYRTPFRVAQHRAYNKLPKDQIFTPSANESDLTKQQAETNQKIWESFLEAYGVDDSWTKERFDKEKIALKFHSYNHEREEKLLGVDREHYQQKYGNDYQNARTRYALKTLKQFLNNMLTPIWVRDCAFNILGRCGYEFEKYVDNIKIELITPE